MLERDVEIGEDCALSHQRDDVVNVGVGVDIVQADPGAELAHFAREVGHVGADLRTFPWPRLVAEVHSVGARILTYDEQLLRAGGDKLLRLAQNRVRAAADEVAAQGWDDAEGAAVVSAFGYLHIAVVPRGQLDIAVARHARLAAPCRT